MTLLISGLMLFFATHLIPCLPKFRRILVDNLKLDGYKLIFSFLSITSIALIVYGLKEAPFVPLYEPPVWGRHLAMLIMLPAVYLFFSNPLGPAPSSAKAVTAHPLNWGVILWSLGHLLANGDIAHVLLFSTFCLFSVFSIASGNLRGQKPALTQRPPLAAESVFAVIVLIVYGLLVWGHAYFTGMALISG